eukprot:764641-Hanusia_phi.AAC.4
MNNKYIDGGIFGTFLRVGVLLPVSPVRGYQKLSFPLPIGNRASRCRRRQGGEEGRRGGRTRMKAAQEGDETRRYEKTGKEGKGKGREGKGRKGKGREGKGHRCGGRRKNRTKLVGKGSATEITREGGNARPD